ncbi:MAG: DegT/DnrJ/EryC1/StrS family aminotransferase [Clostridiales bacterium]|nr:DegT/DnrJ/EryC1/StrS family aminotransferase [Clostridiales bacterium]
MAINVTRSSMPAFEEYCEEIRELWDTHWLTNNGIKLRTLQGKLQEYLQSPYVAMFTNGHLALEAVLASMELEGEVITTPYSFASTTHAIVRNGLKPVFCDIRSDDYTMDASKIEALITDKTCAIVPVHVYGNLCDAEAIDAIAKKHNLKVIYDAAHAFGVTKNGQAAATFGDASMFSFHATKMFNTIEGGAVATNDKALYDRLALERNFGISGPEDVPMIGGNAKMNEFQAAMGLCNLRHVDENIRARKHVHDLYMELLGGHEGITLPISQVDVEGCYVYFPVLFDGENYRRDEVFDKLTALDIHTRKYFYPLITDFECYRGMDGFDSSATPIAKSVSDQILTLPLYPDLADEDIRRICAGILAGRHI